MNQSAVDTPDNVL